MSAPLFDIVFYGILQPGKDRELVMQNMAKLFKTEPARIKGYFSGERKVIKSRVDELVAEKYRLALENVGLVIKIEEIAPPPESAPAAESPAEPAAQQAATARPVDDAVAVDTNGLSVAEVGADVLENPPEVTPVPIGDISDLSMAEVGADVLENPPEITPAPIGDISELSMAEVGADVFEHPPEPPPPADVDISELTMAEPGADVFEHPPEKPKAPALDISQLSVAEPDND